MYCIALVDYDHGSGERQALYGRPQMSRNSIVTKNRDWDPSRLIYIYLPAILSCTDDFFFFLNNPLHFLAGAFFSETLFLVFLESLHVCIMSSIVTICNHCQTYFVIVDNHRYLNEHKLSKSYKLFSYIHQ